MLMLAGILHSWFAEIQPQVLDSFGYYWRSAIGALDYHQELLGGHGCGKGRILSPADPDDARGSRTRSE